VARRAVELAVTVVEANLDLLVAAAWLHDIGYATPLVGACATPSAHGCR
jgi:HD superfamily phosphodiesterase